MKANKPPADHDRHGARHHCRLRLQQLAPTPGGQGIAGYFGILTDIFLRLIKMIIAPLATLVAGLAGMGDSKTVGRIGAKALGWFVGASLCRWPSGCSSPTCCTAALNVPCRKWAPPT
jgi:hypothetical protein